MVVQDQNEVTAFLSEPSSYGAGVDSVERIDTHGAAVFLAGNKAYKLKRAVRFPYMDFSTVEKRRAACEAEIALNRRTAPALYLQAMPITRESSGELSFGGQGEPVDHVVVMKRFDQAGLFSRLVEQDALTGTIMESLADSIAHLHRDAERRPDMGGAEGFAWIVDGIAERLGAASDIFPVDRVIALEAQLSATLKRNAVLLDRRRADGHVRRCHGDLHLRNIVLIDGEPVLFDAVEFNDRIGCIDVFYDLAFLLMDMERRQRRDLANIVFNRYIADTGDRGSLAALPLFLSCRAAIRAHTAAAAATVQSDRGQRDGLLAEAKACFDLAATFLAPPPPRLIAVGGFSGSGKSTFARALAPQIGPAPGAVVLRTDIIRKNLADVPPTTRLSPAAYSEKATQHVYRSLVALAAEAIEAGHGAIADGVFARPEERHAIEAAARNADIFFQGFWLEAPADILAKRIETRRDDASDATVAVLHRQLDYDIGPVDWHRLDSSGDMASTRAAGLARISRRPPQEAT